MKGLPALICALFIALPSFGVVFASAPQRPKLKVYISVDMEGI
jgi:hypothetical protein